MTSLLIASSPVPLSRQLRRRRSPRSTCSPPCRNGARWCEELGGDKVKVYVATNALQDPHHVEAKPSLIARARSADLVVATGAELEIGWLPLVLQQAGNPASPARQARLFRGDAYVDAARQARRASTAPRATCTRRQSAHPDRSAQHRARRGAARGAAGRARSGERRALSARATRRSRERWTAAIAKWEKQAAPLKGAPIVVQHKAFTYLDAWLGLDEIAALEPKPGVEPTTAHLTEVLATAAATAGEDGDARRLPERPRVAMDRRAREDQRRRAAVHRRRRRRGEGSLRPLRRHDRAAAQGHRNEHLVRSSSRSCCRRSSPGVSSPRPTCRSACRCSRAASCSSTSRSRRSPAAACCSPISSGFEAEGIAVQIAALAAALGRRAAAHVDRAHLARRAGGGDRRRVRARRDRKRAAAREQRPRQRASARSAGRTDPVGAAGTPRVGGGCVRGRSRALVRCARAPWPHRASTCCSRWR